MERQLINREWKFEFGDHRDARLISFDDALWQDVGIPHSFSIPFFEEHQFYVGYGTYRKRFTLPEARLAGGRRVRLECEGVFQRAQIYVNGDFVGLHEGGYTAFCYDITNSVRAGENLLAVIVDNLWSPVIAPRAGEHIFCGGIYRDVSLLFSEKAAVAWYGTFVTTAEIDLEKKTAVMAIETELTTHVREGALRLVSEIYDGEGALQDRVETAFDGAAVRQVTRRLENVRFWDIDDPYLYRLVSRVFMDGKELDRCETPFGIREYRFTKDQGFFLNGRHLFIRGANAHQDHAGWGDAVTRQGFTRDLQMIKDCGMNCVRATTYPRHSHYYGECDRLGLLCWAELPYWGIGGVKGDGYWFSSAYPMHQEEEQPFEDNLMQQLREMIRVHRNHPSIITWSMGNEVFFTPNSRIEKAKEFTRRLYQAARELDPTRTISMGGVQRKGFDKLTDLAGYNGDGAKLFIDPGVPNIVSEYGSVVSMRPGKFSGNFHECQNEEFPWRSGQILWVAFHHGSICGDLAHMGMVDYYRLPLRAYYWYRQEYCGIAPPPESRFGIPHHLGVTCDKTVIKNDGTEDTHIVVTVLNRRGEHLRACPTVTMEVFSGGGLFPTGKKITFSRRGKGMLDGKCAIELRGYYSGETKIKISARGLPSEYLTIRIEGEDFPERALVPMRPAPAQYGRDIKSALLISESRPTFASSNQAGFDSSHVNDGRSDTCWKPDLDDGGPTVKVDLERFARIDRIEVNAPSVQSIDVFVSSDGEKLRPARGKKRIRDGVLTLEKVRLSGRYVVIRSTSAGVRNISVYGN